MIILEGPNGAGKSVLAKKLAEELDLVRHKFTEIPNTREHFNHQCAISKGLSFEDVIQDRCPLVSDWVYAPINSNRQPYLSLAQTLEELSEFDSILIFVDADNLKPKNPDTGGALLDLVYKKYLKIIFSIYTKNLPCLYYNYNHTDHDVFLQQLEELKALRDMI